MFTKHASQASFSLQPRCPRRLVQLCNPFLPRALRSGVTAKGPASIAAPAVATHHNNRVRKKQGKQVFTTF
eukprot:1156748-Pelagomonas_calceolata.AAC.5